MNTDKLLNKLLGKAKKGNGSNKSKKMFNNFKPLKQTNISGKSVQTFNKHPIPKRSVIKKAYDKIPDNKNIPLQFMTRKQYLKKYVKNQELQNGSKFDTQTKQEFFKDKKSHYGNILGRYTTKSNPHYPAAVVVFNDPSNFNNIKGNKFDDLVFHEYGHELVEKQGMKMPLQKEEMFADHIADYGQERKIFSDKRAKNYALKKLQLITSDNQSKNKWDDSFFKKSGVFVTKMSPREYLKRTTNNNMDTPIFKKRFELYHDTETDQQEPIEKLAGYIKSDDKNVGIPYIKKNNDHEGRHRAWASLQNNEEDIYVGTTTPLNWRSDDVRDAFLQKRFGENPATYQTNPWVKKFKEADFLTQTMDLVSQRAYIEVLKEKGVYDDASYMPDEDNISKNMARFTSTQEKEINTIDFSKDQRGKEIGLGAVGRVYEVKDNPKYILKIDRDLDDGRQKNTDNVMGELKTYNDIINNPIIIPTKVVSVNGTKALLRPRLKDMNYGMTKKEILPNNEQVNKMFSGVDLLTQGGYEINDGLQGGIGDDGNPYLYDLGDVNNYDEKYYGNKSKEISKINKQSKQKFLEDVTHPDVLKRYEVERIKSELKDDKESKNKWDMKKAQNDVDYYTKQGHPRYIETVPINKINVRRHTKGLFEADKVFYNKSTKKDEPIQGLASMIESRVYDVELPIVSKKDGMYEVSDGRHRIMATADILGNTEVPVVVYKDEDINNDNQSKNKTNKVLKDKIDTYKIAYSRANMRGPVTNKDFVKHKNLGRKRGIIDNTIKKYPNLIPELDNYTGSIIIDESSPDYLGAYNIQQNNISLPHAWQKKPARERAEVLFHELQHAKDAKELNNGEVDFYMRGASPYEKEYDTEFTKVGYKQNKFERKARRAGAIGIGEVDYPKTMTNPRMNHSRKSFIAERMTKDPIDSEDEYAYKNEEQSYANTENNITQYYIKDAMEKLGDKKQIEQDNESKNMAFNLKAESEYTMFDYPRNFGRHRVVSYKKPKEILDKLAKQRGDKMKETKDEIKTYKDYKSMLLDELTDVDKEYLMYSKRKNKKQLSNKQREFLALLEDEE